MNYNNFENNLILFGFLLKEFGFEINSGALFGELISVKNKYPPDAGRELIIKGYKMLSPPGARSSFADNFQQAVKMLKERGNLVT